MLLIYVVYGYSNKNETKKFLVGVIGYPCTCMFPCVKCRTSLGKVPKKWKLNNISSIVRVATESISSNCPPKWGKAMGADHVGWGTSLPQTWLNWRKTVKTTLKIEKFVIRTLTTGTYPGFWFRGCRPNPGGVKKSNGLNIFKFS